MASVGEYFYRLSYAIALEAHHSELVEPSQHERHVELLEADYRCEYCKTSSHLTGTPPVMEHILRRSIGGTDEREKLAASCYRCNEFKGAKTHAVDPETGQLVALFNLRTQTWTEHFAWVNGGSHIAGLTPTG